MDLGEVVGLGFADLGVVVGLGFWILGRVALGKGKVGNRPRPHLKIRPHPKIF